MFKRILVLVPLFVVAFFATGKSYQRRVFFEAPIVLDLDNNGMSNKMAWVSPLGDRQK